MHFSGHAVVVIVVISSGSCVSVFVLCVVPVSVFHSHIDIRHRLIFFKKNSYSAPYLIKRTYDNDS